LRKDLDEMVGRGRGILDLCEYGPRSSAIPLLTLQLNTMERIRATFLAEPLSDLVAVHLPQVSKDFEFALDRKRTRVGAT
jgi:hypothetical protein